MVPRRYSLHFSFKIKTMERRWVEEEVSDEKYGQRYYKRGEKR
jgi:hypothetical protein